MRPYAIYEHPDFSVSSESEATLRKVAAALTVVAASSAAVYEILVRKSRSVPYTCQGSTFLVNNHMYHCSLLALFLSLAYECDTYHQTPPINLIIPASRTNRTVLLFILPFSRTPPKRCRIS
ncbi:hypothetical protein F5J12DRAFT_403917 [Pisolithus orientalis]|uniref:uncharacterized protein n=1 Tax=Pisolithus orientalis TaxID=936130 RepID=UPI0022247128|nr:uncharacterized protein F5J12DRAFT_403917 [Pisolithus orientalis]KAI5995288.1 hypothetical protein F5J12DRAFT_403917 [Pisolithus orientalis]